jgi:hypothetical protein
MEANAEAHAHKMEQAGGKAKPRAKAPLPGTPEKKTRKRIKTPSGKYYEIEED